MRRHHQKASAINYQHFRMIRRNYIVSIYMGFFRCFFGPLNNNKNKKNGYSLGKMERTLCETTLLNGVLWESHTCTQRRHMKWDRCHWACCMHENRRIQGMSMNKFKVHTPIASRRRWPKSIGFQESRCNQMSSTCKPFLLRPILWLFLFSMNDKIPNEFM